MTFDDTDLLELIHLAAYLEGKAKRGLFPKARYWRYSYALENLISYLAEEDLNALSARLVETGDIPRTPSGRRPCREPATVLTHPRFRGRRKPPGGSGPNDAA
jgi:hypothetical protein